MRSEAKQLGDVDLWRASLEAGLGIPFTDGNSVAALKNGLRIFPAMLAAIEEAKESVDFLTFVYWQGDIADQFAQCLCQAAERGVRTRVLLDSFGAKSMKASLTEMMENAGVQVRWFRPLGFPRLLQSTYRTHRKVLVCDGKVGFTGGVGIAAEWEGDAEHPGNWRDTHFRVQGPSVAGLEGAFFDNWVDDEFATMNARDSARYEQGLGEGIVQVVSSSGGLGCSSVQTCFWLLLSLAQSSIRIATPYFVPGADFLQLLKAAVDRGVNVDLLIPGPHSDSRLVRAGARDHFGDLLRAGIRVAEYQPTMSHMKVTTVDGVLACVGSPNFNQRSMMKDDEILLNVLDADLVAGLDQDFKEDWAKSTEVELSTWRKRGVLKRALEWSTRPLRGEM